MSIEYRVLTLRQPWASLVALGIKSIETRSWYTPYRGPLAIHAGLSYQPPPDLLECLKPGEEQDCPFIPERILAVYGTLDPADWPRGVILCKGTLEDCLPTESVEADEDFGFRGWRVEEGGQVRVDQLEFLFGNLSFGGFAWLLSGVKQCKPVSVTGKQGLWKWSGVLE